MKKLLTTAILLLLCNLASAQLFRSYMTKDGLASNNVAAILQDSHGYLWFGTQNGLARFDSHELRTFRAEASNNYSIGNNYIYALFEDSDGLLWIGTEDGIYYFDHTTEQFTNLRLGANIKQNILVKSICQEPNTDRIWISTLTHGVYRYDKESGSIKNYSRNCSTLQSDYVPRIVADGGNIWCIASGNLLYRYNPESDNFDTLPIVTPDGKHTITNAFSLCEDLGGNLWIAGWDSPLMRYNRHTGNFSAHLTTGATPTLPGRVHNIKEVVPGQIYLGHDFGLTIYDIASGSHRTLRHDKYTAGSLSDNFVYDFSLDREGGLWVGTYFGGVNYAAPNSAHFRTAQCSNDSTGRVVGKFCEDQNGYIYIGTDDGGLFRYNPTTGRCRHIVVDRKVPNLNIHALQMDWPRLWVGTYGNGLYCLDIPSGKATHHNNFSNRNAVWDGSVYALHKDPSGTIWIGTKTGIYTYNGEEFDEVIYFGYNNDIVAICGTGSDLWFASINRGLLRYNHRTATLTQENHTHEAREAELPSQINSLTWHRNLLWIGTTSHGLFCHDPQGNTYTHIDMEPLLDGASIWNIIAENDNLWLSTDLGLVRYDIATHHTSTYDHEDGLLTGAFNYNAGFRSSNGLIYLGANGGFNIFNPEDIELNIVEPQITLNSISVGGKQLYAGSEQLPRSLNTSSRITLGQSEATFTINFAATSFWSPHKNHYHYRLVGLNDEWTECNAKNPQANWTNLPAGDYTFEVTACNNDGIWSAPRTLDICVLPYWWATPLAKTLYVLASLLLLGVISSLLYHNTSERKKARIAKEQYRKEKERSDAEIEFFTNIAHEIRTPVTLINAPANECLAHENLPAEVRDNLKIIRQNSEQLVNLTNEILTFRKHSVAYLASPTDVVAHTRTIVAGFQPTAAAHNINLNLIAPHEPITAVINREMYGKILSNLLTNALKFTRDRIDVTIGLTPDGNSFKVSVTDNGIGLSKEELASIFHIFRHYDKPTNMNIPGFGIGLSLANMLAGRMNAKITADSQQGNYTIFEVTIPLRNTSADVVVNEQPLPEAEEKNTSSPSQNTTTDTVVLPEGEENEGEESQQQLEAIRPSILIVDDDKEFLRYMSHTLRKRYTILTAPDGVEALEVVAHQAISVIVSDVMMPRMDGVELCEKLKGDINYCHIPIVLLSTNDTPRSKASGIAGGADVYLDKPVDIDLLTTHLDSLIEKRQMLWNVFRKRPFMQLSTMSEARIDKVFLDQIGEIIDSNISNPNFSVGDLAQAACMSRSVLFAKVKSLAGTTPNNFIKIVRLRKAAEYLTEGKYKINEICYLVGFNTPSYFAKCFQEQFGVMPKEFAAQHHRQEVE